MPRKIFLSVDLERQLAALIDEGWPAPAISATLGRAGARISERTVYRRARERRLARRRTEILQSFNKDVVEALQPGREVELAQTVEGLDLQPGWCFRRRTRLWRELRSFSGSPTLAGFQNLKREAMLFLVEWIASERLRSAAGSEAPVKPPDLQPAQGFAGDRARN